MASLVQDVQGFACPCLTVVALSVCCGTQVLRITGGIERLFRGYTDEEAGKKFKRRLDIYGSIWCCVNAHPGHIW